jgi:hypothetical protein
MKKILVLFSLVLVLFSFQSKQEKIFTNAKNEIDLSRHIPKAAGLKTTFALYINGVNVMNDAKFVQAAPKAQTYYVTPTEKGTFTIERITNGQKFKIKEMEIVDFPNPVLKVSHQDVKGKSALVESIKKEELNKVTLEYTYPDAIQKGYKDDLKFKPATLKIALTRGGNKIEELTEIGKNTIDLKAWKTKVQSGDKLVISFTELKRMSHKSQVTGVTVENKDLVVSIL